MENNLTKSLGNSKVDQISIDSKINLDEVIKILEENLAFLENQIIPQFTPNSFNKP